MKTKYPYLEKNYNDKIGNCIQDGTESVLKTKRSKRTL